MQGGLTPAGAESTESTEATESTESTGSNVGVGRSQDVSVARVLRMEWAAWKRNARINWTRPTQLNERRREKPSIGGAEGSSC